MFPNLISVASGNFTRPADTTAYASGDLVANSTTAGSVVPVTLANVASGAGMSAQVRRVRIRKSGATITNGNFRVHLFASTAPTVSSGDNAAIVIATGAANYLGQVDVTLSQTFTDGGFGATATEINLYGVQTVYALLEARAAYTPASAEVFTVSIEALVQ